MPAARPALGDYELEALIGKGGMAEVYRAVARAGPHAGERVAVKRLLPALAKDPAYVKLFGSEALITSALRHPGIVEVYEAGVAGADLFIAMEYVDGRNLRSIVSQCAARKILLPVDFAAYLGQAIAAALDYAHTARAPDGKPLDVVHCDVSPSNVFISRMGEVKLGDFGVAQAGVEGARGGGAAFGKVRYLAPEQLRGQGVSPRTDVFGLGCIVYELLTNQPAFPGDDANDVSQRILDGVLEPPSRFRPDVPQPIELLVLRALAADPGGRPQSAGEVAMVLEGSYDPAIGTPLAIAAVVRGLFGS
jgi:serine/threonine protein kinase